MSGLKHPMVAHRRYTTGETGFDEFDEPSIVREHLTRPRTTSCIESPNPRRIAAPLIHSISDNFEAVSLNHSRRSRRPSNVNPTHSYTISHDVIELGCTSRAEDQLLVCRELTSMSIVCDPGENNPNKMKHSHIRLRPNQLYSATQCSTNQNCTRSTCEKAETRRKQMNILLKTGAFEALVKSIIVKDPRIALRNSRSLSTSTESDDGIGTGDACSDLAASSPEHDTEQTHHNLPPVSSIETLPKGSTQLVAQPFKSVTNVSSAADPVETTQQGAVTAASRSNIKPSSLGKRKYVEEDDENEEVPGGGEGSGRAAPTSEHSSMAMPGLACHYNKYNPGKYSSSLARRQPYKACENRFLSTAKIEQHFKEVHHYGDYDCYRCLRGFGNDRDLAEHARSEEACTLVSTHIIETELYLVRGSQRRENLKKLGKKKTRVPPEQRWRQMWQCLFPTTDCPSPYRTTTHEEQQFELGLGIVLPDLVNGQSPSMLDLDPATVASVQNDELMDSAFQCWNWFEEREDYFTFMLENSNGNVTDLSETGGWFDTAPRLISSTLELSTPPDTG